MWNFVKDIPLTKGHRSYETLAQVEAGLEALKQKPIQIVWGGRDFCFNMHFYRRWKEFFPGADCHLFEDHGHYILEDGRQAVEEAVYQHFCTV